eukprot:s3119_g1.t1
MGSAKSTAPMYVCCLFTAVKQTTYKCESSSNAAMGHYSSLADTAHSEYIFISTFIDSRFLKSFGTEKKQHRACVAPSSGCSLWPYPPKGA